MLYLQVSKCEKFGYGYMVTQVAATALGIQALRSTGIPKINNFITCVEHYFLIQSGAKKTQHLQTRYSHIIFTKMQDIIYQIKHNRMNFMMLKTVSKNILQ